MNRGLLLLVIVLLLCLPTFTRAQGAVPVPYIPVPYSPQQIEEKFDTDIADGNYAGVIRSILAWMNEIAKDENYSAEVVRLSLMAMSSRLPKPASGLAH